MEELGLVESRDGGVGFIMLMLDDAGWETEASGGADGDDDGNDNDNGEGTLGGETVPTTSDDEGDDDDDGDGSMVCKWRLCICRNTSIHTIVSTVMDNHKANPKSGTAMP